MTTAELAAEYRASAQRYRVKIDKLKRQLDEQSDTLSGAEKYRINGHIRLLASQYRELTKTAIYLEKHYGGRNGHTKEQK